MHSLVHFNRMVATVVERLGRLDIAINNAGLNKNHAAEDCLESDWDQTFELNTKGVFLCCQVRLLAVGRMSSHLLSSQDMAAYNSS